MSTKTLFEAFYMKTFVFKSIFQQPALGLSRTLRGFLILSALLLMPHTAMAQTLGDLICNASHNVAPLGWLMNGLAYIIGAILIGNGLIHLIRHAEKPGEAKLHL